jgi:His/Glu/Gln/Arg/opine family amino acid ABC transporter permease subunit
MLVGLPQLVEGAKVTLAASILAIVLGTIIGVVAGVAEQSRHRSLRLLVGIYISVIRGTPLYSQILVIFFLLPAIGVDLPRFATGVLALALNSGAYISQMIAGALTAIPTGQIEAARALAMPSRAIWHRIVIPQALRLILPPLTIEFTALVKNSAFLSVIGVIELTRTAQQIVSVTFRPTQTWILVAAIYFVLCFAIGLLARQLEQATSAQAAR